MRRAFISFLGGVAGCLLLSTTVLAGGHNAADYTLRVHVFQYNGHSHYHDRTLDYVDGEGRANLYENGQPRGFDFSYRCSDRLRVSAGYETYMAKWRKPGKELEILLPEFGKPGAAEVCGLKVDMKEMAYYRHNGSLDEEPAATFKQWMEKHQYDPEKGLNMPVSTAPAAPTAPSAGPAGPQ